MRSLEKIEQIERPYVYLETRPELEPLTSELGPSIDERPKSYIGVSGLVSATQQKALTDSFIEYGLSRSPISRQLALGVKAVHKTQFLDKENKYGIDWYPVGATSFAGALSDGAYRGVDTLRIAQMFFEPDYKDIENYQQVFTDSVCRRGRTWLNALQFDQLPWHRDEAQLNFLETVKDKTQHQIILQAHGSSMDLLGPDGVAKVLGRYSHAIDYILFDASHGRGIQMNTASLRPFIEAAYDSSTLQSVGIGVAGGLDGRAIRDNLAPLVADFPDLSWDSEAKLHPMRPDGSKPLSLNLADKYLKESAKLLKRI